MRIGSDRMSNGGFNWILGCNNISTKKHSLKLWDYLQYKNETNILQNWNHIYCKIKKE
jgi:hypothetical protein